MNQCLKKLLVAGLMGWAAMQHLSAASAESLYILKPSEWSQQKVAAMPLYEVIQKIYRYRELLERKAAIDETLTDRELTKLNALRELIPALDERFSRASEDDRTEAFEFLESRDAQAAIVEPVADVAAVTPVPVLASVVVEEPVEAAPASTPKEKSKAKKKGPATATTPPTVRISPADSPDSPANALTDGSLSPAKMYRDGAAGGYAAGYGPDTPRSSGSLSSKKAKRAERRRRHAAERGILDTDFDDVLAKLQATQVDDDVIKEALVRHIDHNNDEALEDLRTTVAPEVLIGFITADYLMHDAAEKGKDAAVTFMVQKLRLPVDARDGAANTLLHHAICNKNIVMRHKMVKCLLEELGADCNAQNDQRDTVLHRLMDRPKSRADIDLAIDILMMSNPDERHLASVTVVNAKGERPFDKLFEVGRSATGLTPLHACAYRRDSISRANLVELLEQGADPSCEDVNRELPIHHAVQEGNVEMVRYLKEHCTSPDWQGRSWQNHRDYYINRKGRTALQMAQDSKLDYEDVRDDLSSSFEAIEGAKSKIAAYDQIIALLQS